MVSSGSGAVSLTIGISTVLLVSPAAKFTVIAVFVWSPGDLAVPSLKLIFALTAPPLP